MALLQATSMAYILLCPSIKLFQRDSAFLLQLGGSHGQHVIAYHVRHYNLHIFPSSFSHPLTSAVDVPKNRLTGLG